MSTDRRQAILDKIASFPYWYHQIEVAPGVITPGINESRKALEVLDLPTDCSGLRALDIGPQDGFFSFELERRGASVLAIDNIPAHRTGFPIVADILNSHVRHEMANIYDLSPERFGQFEIVLCLGVLYHLRNPVLALDKIRSVCRGRLWLESHVIDNAFVRADGSVVALGEISAELAETPIMQFYPRNELTRDFSNWTGPNMACLRAMAEAANFSVESSTVSGSRGIIQCSVAQDSDMSFYIEAERSLLTEEDALDRYQSLLKAWPRQGGRNLSSK